jgi:hypothetical protein
LANLKSVVRYVSLIYIAVYGDFYLFRGTPGTVAIAQTSIQMQVPNNRPMPCNKPNSNKATDRKKQQLLEPLP